MKQLVTFKPSFFDKVFLILACLESQLRSDWINLFYKPAQVEPYITTLQRLTRMLIAGTRPFFEQFKKSAIAETIYGADPKLETTCTNTLTPALLFLHARLYLEQRHYAMLDKQITATYMKEINQGCRVIDKLMPSWEHRRRKQIKQQAKRENYYFNYLFPDNLMRMFLAFLTICVLAASGAILVINFNAVIIFIATKMVTSGLPFYRAYSAFSVVAVVFSTSMALAMLEVFHQPSNQNIYNFLVDMDKDTQERLAEVTHTLDVSIPENIAQDH